MALRTPTLPENQEQQDSLYNPGERQARELTGDHEKIEGYDREADGLDKLEDQFDDSKTLREDEDKGSLPPDTNWRSDFQRKTDGPQKFNVRNFLRKRGPIIGIISALGISGGLLAGVFGPSTMLVNLMENLTLTNDSSSTVMERRFMKVFGTMTAPSDPVCANSSKSIKCKQGRISNKALAQLQRKGITPIFDVGVKNTDKKTGYPSKNPSMYRFDLGGGKVANVAAPDMPGYLASNPKVAASVLGRAGAFNLRIKAWTGKYISQKLFSKLSINRAGGIADGKNKKVPASEQASTAFERLKERVVGLNQSGNAVDRATNSLKGKVDKQLGSAKKGGTGYVLAVAGCMGVKAPGYIAAAIAAVQLAQILPVAHEVILSPGSKLKLSGVETANAITPEDLSTTGSLLTNKTPRASDGKLTSALDSPYLLNALGVNKSKLPVSKAYTPGFGALMAVQPALKAEAATRDACNAILSPAAMYSALAVDAAVTVAASATVIGGVVKVIASFAISEAVTKMLVETVGGLAKPALLEIAKNDAVPKAQGEALGDVLGISATSFFASGAMARNIPGLKMSQLPGYTAVKTNSENFQREMDIASLSPFDISSPYTFLGSMVHSFSTIAQQNGSYGSGLGAQLANFGQLALSGITPTTSAATDFTAEYCGYADDFGLALEDPGDTPAITMSGLPCTGFTPTQAGMSTSRARELIRSEGWLDENKDFKDGATISDLVKSGYIKSDTPLSDAIESCGDALTGDYLFNAAGCTTNSETKNVAVVSDKLNSSECAGGACDLEGVGSASSDVSAAALEAIPVFLVDIQEMQSINGEDEEVAPTGNGGYVSPLAQGFDFRDGFGPRPKRTANSSTWHAAQDIGAPRSDKSIYAIADGTVQSIQGSGVNAVRIEHADGMVSVYLHMYPKDVLVKVGDTVTAGQKIGTEGCAGGSNLCQGPHLHIEIDVSGLKDPDDPKYASYERNAGGAPPKGTRIDPRLFLHDQGVEGF